MSEPLEIGVMLNNLEPDRLRAFRVAADLGFRVVHTSALPEAWLSGPQRTQYVAAARDTGVTIDTMFVGFDGQSYRDIPSIRRTVGLVLTELREPRTRAALAYCDLAAELGVMNLAAHLGFLPEDPENHDYVGVVESVRRICDRCRELGQRFNLETGQESGTRLLDFITDVDRSNLGVNFDPANFLLYGTDDPLRALRILGPFVYGVHAKDAVRSMRPESLGTEVPIGQGRVPFEEIVANLVRLNYQGPLVIEREHGANVAAEVSAGRDFLRRLVGAMNR